MQRAGSHGIKLEALKTKITKLVLGKAKWFGKPLGHKRTWQYDGKYVKYTGQYMWNWQENWKGWMYHNIQIALAIEIAVDIMVLWAGYDFIVKNVS